MLAFAEGTVKKVLTNLENVLAFPEGAVKEVLVSSEKCWHLKELSKSICNLKNVFASLDMCWQSQKKLLKKCWQV